MSFLQNEYILLKKLKRFRKNGNQEATKMVDKQETIKIGRDEVIVTYNKANEIVAVCIDVFGYDEVILFRDEHFAREEDSEDREIDFVELGMEWAAGLEGYDDRQGVIKIKYLFKIYDLKELKDFDLFDTLDMISDNQDVSEFGSMEEVEDFVRTEIDEGESECIDEPEYVVIVDTEKKSIIKKAYTLRLESKTFKSDEEIQKLIDVEVEEAEKEKKRGDKIET